MARNCFSKNQCVLLIFIIAVIPGILSPVLVFIWSRSFYEYWKPIYSLNIIFFINCGWEVVTCAFGFLLLLGKAQNKLLSALYSFGLFTSLLCSVACLAVCQLADTKFSSHDKIVVQNLRDFYADNEDVPGWMHQVQHEMSCCGFQGPNDWKEFIYPADKPAIEDVPQSCCIVQAIGCNLITGELRNNTELSKWIHTNGCRKHVEEVLQGAMNLVFYADLPIILTIIILLPLYWYQVSSFGPAVDKQSEEEAGLDLPNETGDSEFNMVASAGVQREKGEEYSTPPKSRIPVPNPSGSSTRVPLFRKRAVALFEDEYVPQSEPRWDNNRKRPVVSFDDDLDDLSEHSGNTSIY